MCSQTTIIKTNYCITITVGGRWGFWEILPIHSLLFYPLGNLDRACAWMSMGMIHCINRLLIKITLFFATVTKLWQRPGGYPANPTTCQWRHVAVDRISCETAGSQQESFQGMWMSYRLGEHIWFIYHFFAAPRKWLPPKAGILMCSLNKKNSFQTYVCCCSDLECYMSNSTSFHLISEN